MAEAMARNVRKKAICRQASKRRLRAVLDEKEAAPASWQFALSLAMNGRYRDNGVEAERLDAQNDPACPVRGWDQA